MRLTLEVKSIKFLALRAYARNIYPNFGTRKDTSYYIGTLNLHRLQSLKSLESLHMMHTHYSSLIFMKKKISF